MTIILFILILGLLIFVHELGHFMTAKWFGIRVDEFGMGLPPRAAKLFSRDGTDYTLNWIPFGGFVKIYGEDALEEGSDKNDPDYGRSFVSKKWWQQLIVLVAGVTMNFILAWFLFAIAFMIGAPTSAGTVDDPTKLRNPELTVLSVLADSPAQQSGIQAGDQIVMIESLDRNFSGESLTPTTFTDTIRSMPEGTPVHIQVERPDDDTVKDFLIVPQGGISGEYPAIGVSVDTVGLYRQGFFGSIWDGLKTAGIMTADTFRAFGKLIGDAFRGEGTTDNLSGPVGLAKMVGDAQQIGFVYVIMLTALISINLAVLNIAPFPALDGGRVVMVLIEAITRKKIKPAAVQWINTAGFFILIGLILFVTVKDVIKLF